MVFSPICLSFFDYFLDIDGPVQGDVGRFLSSFDPERHIAHSEIKTNWDLVALVSRDAQSKRICETLDSLDLVGKDDNLVPKLSKSVKY